MRFKVEIEARLASLFLWIPSTLVFFSQDTLSRRSLSLEFSEIMGLFKPRQRHFAAKYMCRCSKLLVLDSVERKGFEPSTPGLQSRCSPS